MPRRPRPDPVTTFERDKCRYNLAWSKYGFVFHYQKQPREDMKPGQRTQREHMIVLHNKLGVLCEMLRWELWRPCFSDRLPDLDVPAEGEYECLAEGHRDWRAAALASLHPETLPKQLFSRRQIIARSAWRDPFIVSVLSNLLTASINSSHHAYSTAGPIPAP